MRCLKTGLHRRFIKGLLKLCLVLAACVACTLGQITAKPQQVCTHNGHTYQAGEHFSPSPCEHCFCSTSGNAECAMAGCMYPMCVDDVHDPTQCCPTCPNGPNCQHTDGTIIQKGESYSPDATTHCRCPENSFGFSSLTAICIQLPLPPQSTVRY